MNYNLIEQLANSGNYGGSRSANQIKYLVYHYTGNDGDKAANNASYFQRNIVEASSHYFVDDTTVYRSVPDLKVAWAVGGSKYANADATGGGTMYGKITNTNSISIEMCDTIKNGVYQASESTMENAAVLGRDLMEKYNIPIENVYRHFDVTGKHCPSYLVNESKWETFKSRLEDEDMNVKKLTKDDVRYLISQIQSVLAEDEPSDTLKPELDEAIAMGITDGKNPNSLSTRIQTAVMCKRTAKYLENK